MSAKRAHGARSGPRISVGCAALLIAGASTANASEPSTSTAPDPSVTTQAAPALEGAVPAPPASKVRWDPSWRRFGWVDAVGTLAVGAGALAIALTGHRETGHEGGVFLDDATRDLLVAETAHGRDRARILGDRIFQTALVYPYLVDVLLVTWIGHDAPDVAAQMALMNAQAQAFAALIGLSTAHFIGRARPSNRACAADPSYETHCGAVDENASFMSGHTATAAVTAGLVCAHNSNLPLYGDTPFGLVECLGWIGAAATTGAMRIVADRHWQSDVVAGATLGAFSGYGLPMLLHYGWSDHPEVMVAPMTGADQIGLTFVGELD